MDTSHRRITESRAYVRHAAGVVLYVLLIVVAFASPTGDRARPAAPDRNSIEYFRHDMWRTIRAGDPTIAPVANAIRAITRDPLKQIAMVNDVTTLLVEYDSDMRVYGVDDFHATLQEMIARQRAGGWAYLRDDCDGRAVFAAHLLAALGIPWRLEASYWKEHAWVVARVNGVDYDLLDLRGNAPEFKTFGFKVLGHWFVRTSHPPPPFNWRAAWAVYTHHNLKIGLTLGMLTLDSTPHAMHERHARDWTELVPDGNIPPPDDPRTVLAGVTGFPYGEPLRVGSIAGTANPVPAAAVATPPVSLPIAVLGSVTAENSLRAPDGKK